MLLLRTAGATFSPPAQPPSIDETRSALRKAIWHAGDPFGSVSPVVVTTLSSPLVGTVTQYKGAVTFKFDNGGPTKSRVTRFTPARPVRGHYAIYHEGHSVSGVVAGSNVIDSLLFRGWEVYAMDMPLTGANRETLPVWTPPITTCQSMTTE